MALKLQRLLREENNLLPPQDYGRSEDERMKRDLAIEVIRKYSTKMNMDRKVPYMATILFDFYQSHNRQETYESLATMFGNTYKDHWSLGYDEGGEGGQLRETLTDAARSDLSTRILERCFKIMYKVDCNLRMVDPCSFVEHLVPDNQELCEDKIRLFIDMILYVSDPACVECLHIRPSLKAALAVLTVASMSSDITEEKIHIQASLNLLQAQLDEVLERSNEASKRFLMENSRIVILKEMQSRPSVNWPPQNVIDVIMDQGGVDLDLISDRNLSRNDVKPKNARLKIYKKDRIQTRLTPNERELERIDGVSLIQPNLDAIEVKLRKWKEGYVIAGHWTKVFKQQENRLEFDRHIRLYSYRRSGNLCFALVTVD